MKNLTNNRITAKIKYDIAHYQAFGCLEAVPF